MNSLTILLVDDDAAQMKTLKGHLEPKGHRVTVCSTGAQAVAILEKQTFNLVITDADIPGRDGIEVILERGKTDAHARVIALSGDGRFGTDQYLLLVKKLGADAILKRPFSTEQLFAAIEAAVKK